MREIIASKPFEGLFVAVMAPLLLFFGLSAAYLWRLLAASRTPCRRTPQELNATSLFRFLVIVPAHNEALLLGSTLASLRALNYPAEGFAVLVTADNCSDGTADIAREYGAVVLERTDAEQVGKGWALAYTIDAIRTSNRSPAPAALLERFHAVVIVDADTLVDPQLLQAFAAGLGRGERAMQGHYTVLNPDESWRTRLLTCALGLAHYVKPLGREMLGLSAGLKGNGMCFARAVAEQVQWSGDSITEDIAYTISLARQGIRVAFVPDAGAAATMPAGGRGASTQRRRWEGGRLALARMAPGLLIEAIRARNRLLADVAIDLLIPPLSESTALPALMLAVSVIVSRVGGAPVEAAAAAAWAAILTLMVTYVMIGLRVARVPGRIARSLLVAPVYIVWKLGLSVAVAASRSAGQWVRTDRSSP